MKDHKMPKTWEYSSPLDSMSAEDLPVEWIWERLRNRRNELLKESDYRVVVDSPFNVQAWIEYREALRNLPNTNTDPRLIKFPAPPVEA